MEYHTTTLQPLKSYPTYQFHAFTASEKLKANDVFKICILETLKWIRMRLRKFSNIPEELNTPDPEEYEKFSDSDIRSFSFLSGAVNAVYIPKKGIWAFNILENDAGVNIGKENERLPVIGRTFNTEVTFVKHEKNVEFGIRTVCSEPSDCEEQCEVFRPMLVKSLAFNSNVGFVFDGFKLNGSPLVIETKNNLDYFGSLYGTSGVDMPIILIAESGSEEKEKPKVSLPPVTPELPINVSKTIIDESEKSADLKVDMSKVEIDLTDSFKKRKELEKKLREKFEKKEEKKIIPKSETIEYRKLPDFPYGKLANSLVGFSVVCFVNEKFFKQLKNKYNIQIGFGDIIIFSHGKELEHYNYSPKNEEFDLYNELKNQSKLMLKGGAYTFGEVVFYSEARVIELQEKRHEVDNYEAKYNICRQENDELKKQLKELEQQNINVTAINEQLRVTQKKLDNTKKALEAMKILCDEQKERIMQYEENNKKTPENVELYRNIARIALTLPIEKDKVCDWVEKTFPENIIITSKAKSTLSKYDGALSIGKLCDGIIFLNAHADYLKGKISKEMCDIYAERCSWTVQWCGKTTLKECKDSYIAKHEGEDYLMDMHIKSGTDKQTMIRIYFRWEDKIQKIIIGYMPGHLPTASQST